MKFAVAGNKIVCSRKDNTVEENDAYRHVVEFDAHVDTVPPHVAARLSNYEVDHLGAFMADRRRIKANPAEKNMLEALPGLLEEATEILESVERVNSAMYQQLSTSISNMRAALESVKSASKGGLTPIKKMHDSEAQKARLENIARDL